MNCCDSTAKKTDRLQSANRTDLLDNTAAVPHSEARTRRLMFAKESIWGLALTTMNLAFGENETKDTTISRSEKYRCCSVIDGRLILYVAAFV